MTTRELEARIRRLEQTVAWMAALLSAYLGVANTQEIIRRLGEGDGSH
jgi:uncharacterized coiled-coil protein SlyX